MACVESYGDSETYWKTKADPVDSVKPLEPETVDSIREAFEERDQFLADKRATTSI
jgi:hypothetical protein